MIMVVVQSIYLFVLLLLTTVIYTHLQRKTVKISMPLRGIILLVIIAIIMAFFFRDEIFSLVKKFFSYEPDVKHIKTQNDVYDQVMDDLRKKISALEASATNDSESYIAREAYQAALSEIQNLKQ